MSKSKSKSKDKTQRVTSYDWTREALQLELETAFHRGYLVLPGNCLRGISICNTAFESALKVQLPADGNIILHLQVPTA